jgi:hypothetical protein
MGRRRDVFNVRALLDEKVADGKTFYLVQWEDCEVSRDYILTHFPDILRRWRCKLPELEGSNNIKKKLYGNRYLCSWAPSWEPEHNVLSRSLIGAYKKRSTPTTPSSSPSQSSSSIPSARPALVERDGDSGANRADARDGQGVAHSSHYSASSSGLWYGTRRNRVYTPRIVPYPPITARRPWRERRRPTEEGESIRIVADPFALDPDS